mgnify:CR=1 FL=1
MEKFHARLGAFEESIVDVFVCNHSAHGNGGVIDALGHGANVRCDAKVRRRICRAQATEGGDDLIEDQQDAVFGGNLEIGRAHV